MPFTTSRPKPRIPDPFVPKAQAPSPVEEAEMAAESPRTLGIRGMQGIIKHRAQRSQPAQPFQSSPSTASPLTPPIGEHHDDVNSSFSYPASFGGSHHFPSKSFRFSFKAMARQPSTSNHRKGYSTTTAEEYLRSVVKRDSDDGSKYGVLTDDPFRSESRLGGGDSDYYEGPGDGNGDESDYYAEDANAKHMAAAANPSPMSEGDTCWPHNVREELLKEEVEEIEEEQQSYQDETPVHRVLEPLPTQVKVTPSGSSTHSSNKTTTKRPLFVSPFSPFGRMTSAGIRLRFSSIVGRSAAPAAPSPPPPPPPPVVVSPQPIEEEPLSPVSTLHSPLAATPPQIEVNLPDPELFLDHTSFPQPPPVPFRPRFLARPPGSVVGPSFARNRNSIRNSGGLQLRLQASPQLLSPSIPPSPVRPWHQDRDNDELSSPPHSLWTVDLPNTPGTSRPTTLWVVGKLQDHLERSDQMSDFSFDLTPPARFATLPTLDEDRSEAGSSTIHTHTRTNSLTSISSRPPRPRRAPPPLPPVENGGRLSLISEVDSCILLDTPLPPVCSNLVPPSSTASSSSATFRQQLEDKFPAPPPTEPATESDDDESRYIPSPARSATSSPPSPPPKSQPQPKPPQPIPRRRSEDSFRAIPVREADLEEAIRFAKAREESKQSIQVALEDPSDEDSAYGEDEFSEQESDAQAIPITYAPSPLVTPPPFQRRLPSGVSKVLRYFFS